MPGGMIYSKRNAGQWVASKDGKVLATDPRLSAVLRKVKRYKTDEILLDRVPKTPFLAG
jgi:ferric-dicitrate binding protein FerR (iron transport regulator)